ncbi:MAG: hypothetical protein H8E46_00975 [FCB group bacterium]|nr:hypothetical protein [FCB group bacterium]
MINRMMAVMLIISLTLLCSVSLSHAQTAYQPVGTVGGIDYGGRVIITKGMGLPGGIGGRMGQIRAAIMDAQRNYLEVVKGAYVNSESTVEGGLLTGDVIQSRVEGLVRNFTPTDTSYWDDGTIEITLQFDMAGQFLDATMPKNMGSVSAAPRYLAPPSQSGVFTGMIVDARGLGIRPALAPKIIDEQGKEVYGSSYVSREYAIQQGMVGYAKDPNKAKTNNRVSPNPLFVKGLRADGPNRTDVVISDSDAASIFNMSENMSFLRKCQVMILVD